MKDSWHLITVLIDHNNLYYFMITTSLNRRQVRWTLTLVEYDFEIKYCTENINLANNSSKRLDYKKDVNDEICFFTLQNKLKNIIIAVVNLMSIFTRSVIKTLRSRFVENVEISSIIQNTEKEIFEKDEKNLIDNVIIQYYRRNDAKAFYEMKKFLKFCSSLLIAKIEKFQIKNLIVNRVKLQLKALEQ